MAEITALMVKELRNKTGAGMMDCKRALEECSGNFEGAFDFLRKKGIATASKRAGKVASEGVIQSYIHMGNKIGVIVEINCETDFVAKTNEFVEFAKNIAMHIAATNPVSISPEDVPQQILEKEKDIYKAQALEMGKPEKMIDNIVKGKIDKFFKENCVLNQKYVKDIDKTVKDYITEIIAKTGEKIEIRRFVRFQIGDN